MAGFGAVASRVYGFFTRNSRTARSVVDHAGLEPGDRVLDVGCGAGSGVAHAAERTPVSSVVAVDPSPTFVAMVQRRVPAADVRVAGAEDLPFDDGSFTVIWTVASMHHWDDRDRGLADLVRTLAPGGRLLIAERALKRPGHGITAEQARVVMDLLNRLGQTDVRTATKRVGALRLTIIESTKPDEAGSAAAGDSASDGPAAD